jgi:GNAT superfamily N-acetyltransferase
MQRTLPGGYELDDDRARIDLAAITAFLTESYWAEGRSAAEQQALNDTSARLVGLYRGAEQVGFARISYWEERNVAFLNDVYVLEAHRGHGLGLELVRETVDGFAHADAMWLLRTDDMHALYEKLGFERPDEKWMVRAARLPLGRR